MKKENSTKLKKVVKKKKTVKKTTKTNQVKSHAKAKKACSYARKNGLHKDIVVLEEKIYRPPTRLTFWFSVLISIIIFEVFLKQIPFLYEYWEVLTAKANLKLYALILIIALLIGLKIYIDHKLKNKINLKM